VDDNAVYGYSGDDGHEDEVSDSEDELTDLEMKFGGKFS
jgi:hypothetical protein